MDAGPLRPTLAAIHPRTAHDQLAHSLEAGGGCGDHLGSIFARCTGGGRVFSDAEDLSPRVDARRWS